MIPSINRLAELLKDNSQFNQSVRKDGDKKAKLIEEKFSHGTKEPKKKTTASRFTKSYIDFQIDHDQTAYSNFIYNVNISNIPRTCEY